MGLFAFVYENYYVNFAFRTHRTIGGIICIAAYFAIYFSFCNLYKAFRIASVNITDTIFSQTISFGLADLVLYIECCLMHRNKVSIWIGALAFLFQFLGTILIVLVAKQALIKRVIPKETLLIYGSNIPWVNVDTFRNRLLVRYNHLFDICYLNKDDDDPAEIDKNFEKSKAVIMFEMNVEKRAEYIRRCLNNDKIFYFTPEIEDIMCQGCRPKHMLDTPLLKYEYGYMTLQKRFTKRMMDILFAMILIIATSPFMLITAFAVKLQDGGPILYKQRRYTKGMREFTIYKFRSMIVDAEKNGAQPATVGDSRITKVGAFIRATRIDELPQLFNILKGDMSFVGPRPERIEHVEKYTAELPEFKFRLAVKGGLTGYAQIYGKYNTSAYDKLRLDLMYIENQSLFLDIKLCLLTFKTIFEKESTEGFGNIEGKYII